jgi:hypothetical protein
MPLSPHPKVRQPDGDGEPVWRFIDLSRFLAMLFSQSLHFAREDQFDDPYEGRLPDEMMARIKSNNPLVFTMWRQLGQNSQFENYVNCWYMGKHETEARWKPVAGRTVDVAVVSTYRALLESFHQTPEQVTVGIVEYGTEHLVNRTAMPDWMEFSYWKRKEFESEKEVRAVIHRPLGGTTFGVVRKAGLPVQLDWSTMTGQETPHGLTVRVDLHSLVHKVVVSPERPTWLVDVLTDVIQKYGGLRCPVEQSSLYALGY